MVTCLSLLISISISSFFVFLIHPNQSKQMAVLQSRGLPDVSSHWGVFCGHRRFMLTLDRSLSFLPDCAKCHWVWFSVLEIKVDWLILACGSKSGQSRNTQNDDTTWMIWWAQRSWGAPEGTLVNTLCLRGQPRLNFTCRAQNCLPQSWHHKTLLAVFSTNNLWFRSVCVVVQPKRCYKILRLSLYTHVKNAGRSGASIFPAFLEHKENWTEREKSDWGANLLHTFLFCPVTPLSHLPSPLRHPASVSGSFSWL